MKLEPDPIRLEIVKAEQAKIARLEEELRDRRAYRDYAIRQAREAGHTVREIGDAAGIHYSYISRVGARKEDPR